MKYSFNELEKWQKIGIVCLLVVIPGIVGWLVEFFFGWFDNGMTDVYWKGGNFLPWINMYPIGSFLIIACTYKFRDKPLKVLIMSVLASTIFELVTGFILDKVFNAKYWDYYDEFLNFGGYICLISVVGFAIGGLFLIYGIVPLLIKLSKNIPKKVFLIISITLCTLVLADEIYNLIITRIFDLPNAIEIYTSCGIKYL